MSTKYMLVALGHLIAVSVVLKVLQLILPCCITCYYTCAATSLMAVIVAKMTFGLTKKKLLAERIQPDNRAVLITGCDSGFGHNLAKQLDSKGFHVFASCLFSDGPGADDLRKSCSKRLQILGLDVSKDESVKDALEFVKENLGTSELWAIVNNAGIVKGYSVELSNMQSFKDTFEINTFGVVRVTKAFLPLLRQSRGRVVNLCSLAGRIPLSHCTAYTMSKFAAVAFTECLRQEMSVWGVKVVSVEPECFETGLTKPENICNTIEATFADIEEDIRSDYGDQYLKGLKENFVNTVRICSSKMYKVLNALEDAISLEEPDYVYRPCRNIVFSAFFKLIELIPRPLNDFLRCNVYATITGFPTPKEASNS
ncbi:hypothetical protein JTE90_019616 [Oedothorax gibbosus]|uniref:Estradiol 17-beta-dehydrogenase 2 n=1 Tax=Oedothorax gibbosus TaxID=931172 RepID=A0AAV6V5Z6_9ARAC|nr:hypothetical protein JTE90_019616 [Oedothorax gibbosus]